jgi:hypothetical protein
MSFKAPAPFNSRAPCDSGRIGMRPDRNKVWPAAVPVSFPSFTAKRPLIHTKRTPTGRYVGRS